MTDTLRRSFKQSGETVYAVAKATGLTQQALGKFFGGKQSLRLDLADRLADHFKLELVKRKGR